LARASGDALEPRGGCGLLGSRRSARGWRGGVRAAAMGSPGPGRCAPDPAGGVGGTRCGRSRPPPGAQGDECTLRPGGTSGCMTVLARSAGRWRRRRASRPPGRAGVPRGPGG